MSKALTGGGAATRPTPARGSDTVVDAKSCESRRYAREMIVQPILAFVGITGLAVTRPMGGIVAALSGLLFAAVILAPSFRLMILWGKLGRFPRYEGRFKSRMSKLASAAEWPPGPVLVWTTIATIVGLAATALLIVWEIFELFRVLGDG